METVIEKSISNNGRCFDCGGLVYAVEKRRTTKHIYHNQCFRCRICKRNLTGLSLNEEGDDIYCENCYRKKLRGECHSVEFQRAALEKAQYIYNQHHRDITLGRSDPRTLPLRPELARHPSLTLRQLERKYLSLQEGVLEKAEKQPASAPVASHDFKVKTIFTLPVYLRKFQEGAQTSKENIPSPPLRFSSVSSTRSSLETILTPTPKESNSPVRRSSSHSIRRFLFNSSLPMERMMNEASRRASLPKSRKLSVSFDTNERHKELERKYSAPALVSRSSRSRSSSSSNRLATVKEWK